MHIMMNKVVCQIVGLLLFWMGICPLKAQTVRTVRVSQEQSYTDHVSLKQDSRDMDLIVKFVFDEPNNVLTVSLMSYRNLFVFQDDVRYKQAVKRRKLVPDRLPYVVEADADMKYRLTKELRKQIVGSKKKHIFKRWVDYEGLQPQPMDYKMLNDYIEQKFDILNKDTLVTLSLYDVMVMEASQNKKKSYDFLYYTNMDRKYEIHLDRNPCLGREEEIEMAEVAVENIRTNYVALKERYESHEALSKETLAVLEEMRAMLLKQFPSKKEANPCFSVRQQWGTYNCYVDSIRQLEKYVVAFESQQTVLTLGAEQILSVARIVDNNVASWLISTDVVEKEDLVKRSQMLIDEIVPYLMEDVVMDENQAAAVNLFRKAENYFRMTCIQTKKGKKK